MTIEQLNEKAIKKLAWMSEYEKSLNRRSVVEGYLFRVASGSEPLPDRDKCRELAIKLGVPESWTNGADIN